MEASERMNRCNVDSAIKLIQALETVGVDLIGERAVGDEGWRGDLSESALTGLGTSPYFIRAAGG